VDVESVLVRYGADLDVRDNEGITPLMESVIAGVLGGVERLLNLGADPMIRNGRGDTPLHIAVAMERSDLATLLLSQGVSIHARNSLGITPFRIALSTSPRMVATLLTKDRIYPADDDGHSPLHIAVLSDVSVDMLRIILDQGVRISAVDSGGRTALRMAMDQNNWEAAKLLSDSGSDPFAVAGDGRTPAEIAIAKGLEPVRALFSGRAITSRDSVGNTVLHYAAQNGSPELITLLIELGANKSIRNLSAESPSDVARRWNRPEIAALLNT
jgi:ankyrin repeat protein